MGYEGFAIAGAQQFTAASQLLMGIWNRDDLRNAETKAEALYKKEYEDKMAQQGFENNLASENASLNKRAFSFGVQKWGKEFQLSKRQYLDNKKLAERTLKSKEGRDMVNSFFEVSRGNSAIKDEIFQRYQV